MWKELEPRGNTTCGNTREGLRTDGEWNYIIGKRWRITVEGYNNIDKYRYNSKQEYCNHVPTVVRMVSVTTAVVVIHTSS